MLRSFESRVGYQLIREIGRGSFAKVYLARRRGLGLDRYVAVKLVDISKMDEKFRSVVLDEAKITGRLNHPNIIHIYDCGIIAKKYFFLVTELINGYSLKEVITRHTSKVMGFLDGHPSIPLSLMKHSVASILIHAARGLDYIHTAVDLITDESIRVIHNDLKPGNILIGMNGSLKVADFGISDSPHRTIKLRGGSPGYISPEWISALLEHDEKIRPQVTLDIYSLGVCLHETLTDRRLFKGSRENLPRVDLLKEMHAQMKRLKPGFTKKINPGADDHLCAIVDRCLEFNPKNRFQSMDEIVNQLDKNIEEGIFHPEILDRRFLAEYMGSLFEKGGIHKDKN